MHAVDPPQRPVLPAPQHAAPQQPFHGFFTQRALRQNAGAARRPAQGLLRLREIPQELRRTMWKLASKTGSETFNVEYDCTEEELREAVSEIVKAVLNMSKDNVGALIVITTQSVPQHILDSGTELGAKLSQPLIECLFNTGADLHDGAVFIHGDKILAAGCFLPLSQNQSLPKELGTRHRAALGVSEQYAVLTIVVSEETGVISVARDGKLDRYYDAVMLTDVIEQVYGLKATQTGGKKKRGRLRVKKSDGEDGK